MKKLVAGCVFVVSLGAAAVGCGGKSDAPAAGSAAAAGTDPAAAGGDQAGQRSGRIDPNAFHKRHDDGSAAAADGSGTPAPELPKMGDRMKALDTDGDGKVSDAERQAGRVKRAEDMHKKLDTNNDGKLSPEELEASPIMGRMMKRMGDVKTIDTDGNGDISAEELAAGMATMRDHRHGGGAFGRKLGGGGKGAAGGGDTSAPADPQ